MNPIPPHQLLRINEVITRTGLSRSTLYLRIKQGSFPRPISLGSRASAWVSSEIDQWIDHQIYLSRGRVE